MAGTPDTFLLVDRQLQLAHELAQRRKASSALPVRHSLAAVVETKPFGLLRLRMSRPLT
jgi:hypothetical protein